MRACVGVGWGGGWGGLRFHDSEAFQRLSCFICEEGPPAQRPPQVRSEGSNGPAPPCNKGGSVRAFVGVRRLEPGPPMWRKWGEVRPEPPPFLGQNCCVQVLAAALAGLAGVLQGAGAAAAVRTAMGDRWRRPAGLLKAVMALQVYCKGLMVPWDGVCYSSFVLAMHGHVLFARKRQLLISAPAGSRARGSPGGPCCGCRAVLAGRGHGPPARRSACFLRCHHRKERTCWIHRKSCRRFSRGVALQLVSCVRPSTAFCPGDDQTNLRRCTNNGINLLNRPVS